MHMSGVNWYFSSWCLPERILVHYTFWRLNQNTTGSTRWGDFCFEWCTTRISIYTYIKWFAKWYMFIQSKCKLLVSNVHHFICICGDVSYNTGCNVLQRRSGIKALGAQMCHLLPLTQAIAGYNCKLFLRMQWLPHTMTLFCVIKLNRKI